MLDPGALKGIVKIQNDHFEQPIRRDLVRDTGVDQDECALLHGERFVPDDNAPFTGEHIENAAVARADTLSGRIVRQLLCKADKRTRLAKQHMFIASCWSI